MTSRQCEISAESYAANLNDKSIPEITVALITKRQAFYGLPWSVQG